VKSSGLTCLPKFWRQLNRFADYWIETHTIGCRNAADDPEDEWWKRHYAIYDEYASDGISVILGDPSDGVFVTITPQKGSGVLGSTFSGRMR
jgi:hypothetical protein